MIKWTLMLKKIEKEIINVFTQFEVDTSPSIEVSLERNLSTPHGDFSEPEIFLNQLETHFL